MTRPIPDPIPDVNSDLVYITRLPVPSRLGTRTFAVGASLLIYSGFVGGLAIVLRPKVATSESRRTQAITLQEAESFAPPPPPASNGAPGKARVTPSEKLPEIPPETPTTLPSELPKVPQVSPSEPAIPGFGGGSGHPTGTPGGVPDGVPGGLPGGVSGGIVGSTLVPPRFDAAYLNNPAPEYPVPSKRFGEEGRVTLRVLVDPEGRAQQLEVKVSSGFARLDRVALETVRRWRFVPARQGATPMAAWVLVPVNFQLEA